PVVCGILIIIIVGGLYFEMESPEFGFPLFASIISASIYFTSLYIEGSASYWEIFVFIGGIILLSLEVFANPGFGISGIAGIILIGLGFFLCLLNNHFYDFSKTSHYLIFQSLTVVICSMIFSVIGSFYLSKKIHTYPNLLKYFSFKIIQKRNNSSSKESLNLLIGKSGIAYTKLYPTGKIIIGKEIYEATSEVPVIEKNEKILVTKIETSQLYVKKL
ncbi:MAG TPA: NfeD family protein, partial [Bacteroidales bacterium]|nr:NfeD family protein [Bacteroidales bacterium]